MNKSIYHRNYLYSKRLVLFMFHFVSFFVLWFTYFIMTSSAFRFQSLHHLIRNQSLIKKPFDLKYSAKSLRSFATHTSAPTTEHLFDTKYLHEMIKSNQTQEKIEYIKQIMEQFHHFKIPPHSFVEEVLHKTIEYNKKLPNVVPVFCHPSTDETEANAVTICGDTHGQYQDFRLIFGESIGGFPSLNNRFIFNGDMVDRGKQSLEIVMSLSLFQILFPKEQIVTITRGNHESIMMTKNYGFAHEVRHKYAQHHTSLYKLFLQYFNSLPFGAVVEKRIFVVHGGLGPQTYDKTIHELNQLRRFGDEGSPPDEFSPEIHDILWAGKEINNN